MEEEGGVGLDHVRVSDSVRQSRSSHPRVPLFLVISIHDLPMNLNRENNYLSQHLHVIEGEIRLPVLSINKTEKSEVYTLDGIDEVDVQVLPLDLADLDTIPPFVKELKDRSDIVF